ncbi:MAG TPA: DUF4261 domain-containing protein [Pirellulaceae bacterium]|nr:DUF4261 domain-containing protein [Pirellulaceae bacterium]HMO93635.1 DUF4261 domain-containing protein [Pirellulaceae bacterium]HMP70507.1 DUF4261 domain-containing protein [Pirellulaceae bacterium]
MAIGISMIMLSTDSPIRAKDVQRHLAENWRDLPAASDIEEKDGTLSLQIGEASLIMAKMPAPIPWSDLEGPCATSILWKNAASEVKEHSFHWIVTVNGDLEPLSLSKLLTQATAAAMAACEEAIGVYWGNATLVIPKNIFIDFAKEVLPHGPPLHIWVDFRVGKDSDTSSSGFTAGMKALGHMEFETQRSPEPPGELRERFLALAGYVVEKGPVIRDGDTVGEDAEERIRVVYSDSSFGHDGKVMRLVYETASTKKPWWKLW